MTRSITIDAEAPETVSVNLVGKMYAFHPPKMAFSLKIARTVAKMRNEQKKDKSDADDNSIDASEVEALIQVISSWLVAAGGRKTATAIQKRLDDPDDALDLDHVMQLLNAMMGEQESENPPTSPND